MKFKVNILETSYLPTTFTKSH